MKAVKPFGKRSARRLVSLVLALALCLSCGLPALAAETVRYTDVAEGQWFAEAVDYCYDTGLILGTGEGKFSPGMTMSRAMLVTILWRVEFSPRPKAETLFSDNMDWDAWYFQAVNWAAENKIASGYGGGLFGVNDPVTREQFATILFNYAVYKNPQLAPTKLFVDPAPGSGLESLSYFVDPETGIAPEISFKDEASIGEYARYAVAWAKEERIMSGKPGNLFDPKGRTTRAEAAVIMRNYMLPLNQRPVVPEEPETPPEPVTPEDPLAFHVLVGDKAFSGLLADNETAKALREMMPFTVDLRDRNGKEKIYDLAASLPDNGSVPQEIRAGDLMLYRNNGLVLFYDSATPYYRYTPLGRITDPTGLAEALAGEKVKVSFQRGPAPAAEPEE